MLDAASPSVAKAWAEQRGLDDQVLRHDPAANPVESPPGAGVATNTWADADLIPHISAQLRVQGNHPEESALLAGHVVSRDSIGPASGINDTRLVTLSTGTVGYHKSFSGTDRMASRWRAHSSILQPLHECAAWRVASGLGPPWTDLVPACVLRTCEGELGSLSKQAPGSPPYMPPMPSQSAADAGAFFDALTGESDRHTNNMLVDSDRLTLIDHGFAFSRPGDAPGASLLQRARIDAGRQALSTHEVTALDRLLASPDTCGLDQVLQPSRLHALRDRAYRMRSTQRLTDPGDY